MKNLLIYVFLGFIILASGCKKTHQDFKYRGKIKSKKGFMSFLLDLHRTDGVLITANLDDHNLDDHALKSYYNYVLRKHNINYMDFRRTLDFYMEDLDKFLDMYNIITDSLKKQMFYLDSIQRKKLSKKNLWPGKTVYLIPFQDNSEDSIPFEIKNPKPGIYELGANIRVFSDDQTANLAMRMMVQYADSTIDTADATIYFKDNQFHNYIVKIFVKDKPKPLRIYGTLLGYTKTLYMHIQVNRIHLVRYTRKEMPWFNPTVKKQVKITKPHK